VVCLDSVHNFTEKEKLVASIENTGKDIIDISFDQMNHFAGNMLQVKNDKEESLLVMSEQAYKSLEPHQIERLQKYCKIVYAPLYTIEQNGGGSARCMLAEVHLPLK
jgi:hypothetical protein